MNKGVYWILGLILVLVLAACAAPGAPTSVPTPERPAAGGPAASPQQQTEEQKLIEGAKKEGKVIMWGNTWPTERKVEQLFEAKYPFLKVTVWDISGAEDLAARLLEETKVGKDGVDTIYISRLLPDLREAGLLAEHNWPAWPSQPGHKYWINLLVSGHLAVYNTELLSPAEAPKNYDDMKNSKWRGKTLLSTSGVDASFRYAYMWREGDKLNWEKAEGYWKDVVANTRPRVGRGFTGPMEMLSAGEYPLIPNMAVGPFVRFNFMGAPVALVPLGQMPGNAFSLAVIKNAPHPNAARLWANFLTTDEAQLALSETQGNPPLGPGAAKKSRLHQTLTQMNMPPLFIPDQFWTPENTDRASKFWLALLGVRG